jgi:dTDP-glucose 4,6-dehydratase
MGLQWSKAYDQPQSRHRNGADPPYANRLPVVTTNMPVSILVTGGAGFIGSALIRAALSGGYAAKVVNLDALTYAADLRRLEEMASDPRYLFVKGDIRDGRTVRKLLAEHQPEIVLHLAAESHVDRSLDDPATFVDTNVVGTYRLLEEVRLYLTTLDSCARGRFRFINVSTDEVFGALGPFELPFTSLSPYHPNSPYSATKAAADHLVRAFACSYNLPAIISIAANNFGPWQFPEKLIPLTIAKALAGEPIPVYGNGEQVRDWTHVDDHVAALLLIARYGRVGETYTVSGGAQRRNVDLVRSICTELDRIEPLPLGKRHEELISFVTDRPGHDFRYALEFSRVRDEFKWQPHQEFELSLREVVQWYVDHREWWQGLMADRYPGDRLGLATTHSPTLAKTRDL